MKFEEALQQFENELLKEYGPCASITKVGLPEELFERVAMDLKISMRYYTSYTQTSVSLRDLGELYCRGVQILMRDKDTF